MSKLKLSSKQLDFVSAFDRFNIEENGSLPSTIAALKLGMTTAAVYQAANRGWLKFFKVGRSRWYGNRSIYLYAEKKSSGKRWQEMRSSSPQDCTATGSNSMPRDGYRIR